MQLINQHNCKDFNCSKFNCNWVVKLAMDQQYVKQKIVWIMLWKMTKLTQINGKITIEYQGMEKLHLNYMWKKAILWQLSHIKINLKPSCGLNIFLLKDIMLTIYSVKSDWISPDWHTGWFIEWLLTESYFQSWLNFEWLITRDIILCPYLKWLFTILYELRANDIVYMDLNAFLSDIKRLSDIVNIMCMPQYD